METLTKNTDASTTIPNLTAVLDRAAIDITFRQKLLDSPYETLAELGLPEHEANLLAPMRRVALEEYGVDVRRFRPFLRDNGAKTGGGPTRTRVTC